VDSFFLSNKNKVIYTSEFKSIYSETSPKVVNTRN